MASFGQKDKQQAHQQWLARMPLPHPAPPAPTSHRKPGNPADQTLTAIVDQLTAGGYPFTMPTRNATASLTTPRTSACTGLTVTSTGDVIWHYRFPQCPYLYPDRLTALVIGLLDPDRPRPDSIRHPHGDAPLQDITRHALHRHGLDAILTHVGRGTGPVLIATNPALPCRGIVRLTDDSELTWQTRAPDHRDGGLPLPDIAATIARTLTRAQHPLTHRASWPG